MILKLISHELSCIKKRLFSHIFSLLFPLVMFVFVIPELVQVSKITLDVQTSVLFMALMVQLPAVFIGKELSSSLLSDQDNLVLKSLLITPFGTNSYIWIKTILHYCYGVLETFVFLMIANSAKIDMYMLQTISLDDMLLLSFMIAFLTPVTGLFIYIISKSKVDGNSVSAIAIVLIMLPVVLVQEYFSTNTQYILSILPNFGVSKYILIKMVGITFSKDLALHYYVILSFVMNIIFILFMFILGIKKTKSFVK